MARKRQSRKQKLPAPKRRSQPGRGMLAAAGTIMLILLGLALVRHLQHGGARDVEHWHDPASHGGLVVPIDDGQDNHYHAEVVLERGGLLKVYMLGEEVTKVVEVEAQTLAAQIKAEGAPDAVCVLLMPMPRPCDAHGKTSRFAGRLPPGLHGKALEVSIPNLLISGRLVLVAFAIPGQAHGHERMAVTQDEEKLYLSPGGKYTEEDIEANGKVTASRKYEGFKARHDMKPRSGDRICPVSLLRANSGCTWVVGGKAYEFCCPPCVDEFVKTAKSNPEAIKEPEDYVLKK